MTSNKARALAVFALMLILVLGLFAVSTRLAPINNFLYQLFYQPSVLYDQWYIHLLIPVSGLLGLALYTYIDYRQHLMPLRQELPDVHYTALHHAKVVIIPRARHTWKDIVYWLSFGTASAILSIVVFTFGMVSFVQAAPGTLTVTIDQKKQKSCNTKGTDYQKRYPSHKEQSDRSECLRTPSGD